MNTRKFPYITAGLLAALGAIHFLLPDRTLLYFGTAEITQGQDWRLFTGHLAHADLSHLLWNALGLAVLGWLIERRSRHFLCAALAAGIVAVSLLLVSSFSDLDYYCGLSGVLNSLLVVTLWFEWRASGSPWVVLVAVACLLKALFETVMGDSLITQISWPPFALSHLAGMSGGLVVLMSWHIQKIIRNRPGSATIDQLQKL